MNKTKRAFQLTASIISIVVSAILIVALIYMISIFNLLVITNSGLNDVYFFRSTLIMGIVFCIAIIIISSLICTKPKNGSTHRGLCITALVLNAILFLMFASSESLFAIAPGVCVGFFIAELCIKNTVETPAVAESTENSAPQAETPKADVDAKIEKIKELNKQGILSDEEMKNLIMNELKK